MSLDRYEEALQACDDIVARCDGEGGPPEPSEHVGWALSTKAFILAREERPEDAAKTCSEIINRFGCVSASPISDYIAFAQELLEA